MQIHLTLFDLPEHLSPKT